MVKLVNDSRAIISMRESDFDTYSAYGEAVDNAVQAGAENVHIKFDIGKDGQKEILNSVTFIDDGHGMRKDVLHQCMQLGYSTRFNDRDGIGRFGVGMTLGAIHECKRVEVYSKKKGGQWNYTYVDIDEITSEEMVNIPDPYQKNPPNKFSKYEDLESGTILIWRKYDRLKDTVPMTLRESKVYLGRTYRYFIWDGVNIYVNGEEVKAIDPLYVKTKKTKFPEDPSAQEFQEFTYDIEVPEEADVDKRKSKVKMRVSLIDKELRPEQGAGGKQSTKERYIDRNEGVSIIRNKREVFYGKIPYWSPKWKEIDRWWGCEISFSAELDSWFAVKNIKRGAIPVGKLYDKIEDDLNGVRKTLTGRVSDYWKEQERKKEEEEAEKSEQVGVTGKHKKATSIAKDTPENTSKRDKDVNTEEAVKEVIKKYYGSYPQEKLTDLISFFTDNEYTIDERSWDSPNFMNVEHLGGRKAIFYNTDHPFFEKYFFLLNAIEDLDEEEGIISEGVLTLIDLLIISFSIAEAAYEPKDEWEADRLIEDLKLRWGMQLIKLFRTWEKKENIGNE